MATKTLLTVEEFLRLPEPFDTVRELVEGELITVSPTMPEHNDVRDTLLVALRNFLAGKGLGRVWSEQAFHLFGDTVRIPDIAFVRAGRSIDPRRLPEGAPDLAIEVISPTNTPREIDQRVSDFFAAGSTRVWLVYPEHREVYVHGLSGVVRRRGDDLLEDPELLPGFSVKVSSLFENA
ncbi:MAG: Uma2 family endonuclease [Terriglobia bacterium]